MEELDKLKQVKYTGNDEEESTSFMRLGTDFGNAHKKNLADILSKPPGARKPTFKKKAAEEEEEEKQRVFLNLLPIRLKLTYLKKKTTHVEKICSIMISWMDIYESLLSKRVVTEDLLVVLI